MLAMMWNNAEGTRPGLSLVTLRYLRRRLLRPSSHCVVVGLADGDLLEAVPLYPAVLVGAPELRPYLRREPVEEMEDGRSIPSEQGACQGEGLAAGVGDDARGDALGRAARLKLVNFVADEQVEEAPHPVLHVVGQRIPLGAGPVGLPEWGTAVCAIVLAAVQVCVGEGDSVLVHDLRRADRAAGDPEGAPRLLFPNQPCPWTRPTAR